MCMFYVYAGGTNLALGTSTFDELNPQIEGNYVTWEAFDGNDFEIYSAEIIDI